VRGATNLSFSCFKGMKIFIRNSLSIFAAAILYCSCTITPYSIGEKWAKEDINRKILKYKIPMIPGNKDRIQNILLFTKYGVTEYEMRSADFGERALAYNQTVRNYLKEEYGFDVFDSSRRESEIITAEILKSYKTINDFWEPIQHPQSNVIPSQGSEDISQIAVSKFALSEIGVKTDTHHHVPLKISEIDSTGFLRESSYIHRPRYQDINKLNDFLQKEKQ
jgi:hypothetical protein